MRSSYPQSICDVFNKINIYEYNKNYGSFLSFKQHIVLLLKLNNMIKELLPTSLRPWCRIVNFRGNIILLETANASWLMRLRYEQNQLISSIKVQLLPSLSAINIIINPNFSIKNIHNIKKI